MRKSKLAVIAILAVFSGLFFSRPAYATFSISIGSDGAVNLGDITPTPTSGVLSNTGLDNVSITTNCSAGYNVYATATKDGSTSLVDDEHNNSIPASSNSIATPAALANNTWGIIAGSGSTPTAFAGLPAYTSNFSAISPIYSVPANSEATIRNDNISIYYGIKVDTDTTPGDYTTNVLYTAVMNGACLRYVLNFDGNGATENNLTSETISYGESVDLSQYSSEDKIKRAGYHLVGWKSKINDVISETTYPTDANVVLNDGASSSMTLIAQWEANQSHTVTIRGDFGTPDCTETYHPTAYQSCKLADGRAYILGNWGERIAFDGAFTNTTNVDGHDARATYYCPSGYSVPKKTDFDKLIIAYGGTDESTWCPVYVDHNSILYNQLGVSSYVDYWSSTEYSSLYAYALVPSFDSSSDYIMKSTCAIKTNKSYTICYKDETLKSVSGDGTYRYGETVNISATPASGYYFKSWTANSPSGLVFANSSSASTSFVMPDSDVIITPNASTTPSGYYEVTINEYNGIASSTGSGIYKQGDTVNISASVSGGYHFYDWSPDSGSVSINNRFSTSASFTMPASNVKITARAFANEYTIAYNANGGSGTQMSTDYLSYQSDFTPSSNTYTKSGTSFVGWSLSPSATRASYYPGTSYSATAIVKEAGKENENGSTITLYAVWDDAVTCLDSSSGCSLADGRTWVYGEYGFQGYWSSSYYCPDGYSKPNNNIYKSLINAYGGKNGTSSDDRLFNAMKLKTSSAFVSVDKYSNSEGYYMIVGSYGAYLMYNPVDFVNTLYRLCYK